MNDLAHADQESTAEFGSIAVPRIGTDATGSVHYYDETADTVYVVADGAIEHTEELDGRPLSDWIGYVGSERGWETRGDGEWFAQLEQIAEAV